MKINEQTYPVINIVTKLSINMNLRPKLIEGQLLKNVSEGKILPIEDVLKLFIDHKEEEQELVIVERDLFFYYRYSPLEGIIDCIAGRASQGIFNGSFVIDLETKSIQPRISFQLNSDFNHNDAMLIACLSLALFKYIPVKNIESLANSELTLNSIKVNNESKIDIDVILKKM